MLKQPQLHCYAMLSSAAHDVINQNLRPQLHCSAMLKQPQLHCYAMLSSAAHDLIKQ